MNQIPNAFVFASFEIEIWILFVICCLVLGIFSFQAPNYIPYTFLIYIWGTTIFIALPVPPCIRFPAVSRYRNKS